MENSTQYIGMTFFVDAIDDFAFFKTGIFRLELSVYSDILIIPNNKGNEYYEKYWNLEATVRLGEGGEKRIKNKWDKKGELES